MPVVHSTRLDQRLLLMCRTVCVSCYYFCGSVFCVFLCKCACFCMSWSIRMNEPVHEEYAKEIEQEENVEVAGEIVSFFLHTCVAQSTEPACKVLDAF